MKKILFALIAAVTFATSITIASDCETSVQSTNYPQCDSYKPTQIECYWYNEGTGQFNKEYGEFYLHTNKSPWQVYKSGLAGGWYDVVSSDRCEYKYMFKDSCGKRYFNYNY